MSGPIVRRYGFPNFEKIFGERPIDHGVEESDSAGTRPNEKAADELKPQPAPSNEKEAAPGGSKAS